MKSRILIITIIALLLLNSVTLVAAQALNGYTIEWWTTDGGGGTSSANSYILSGTIGQADAGQISGGGYTLSGGYWGNATPPQSYEVFLPLAVRANQ